MTARNFPQDFWWGAATSSYQIEGAADADGRGPSIWDSFCEVPGAISDGSDGRVATDHYNRYAADVSLMKDLGLQAYRFSIAWPRIQPTGTGAPVTAGLDFYSRLVDELLAADIRPVVTLYHWDLPQALEDAGGWPNRDTAERFGEYAAIMAEALGDRVALWTTLNEPWCSAFLGYSSGVHAPGRREPAAALAAAHHLNLAHGLGVQAIRSVLGEQTEVGTVINVHQFYPASDDPRDVEAFERAYAVGNDTFLTPVLQGRYTDKTIAATKDITDWGFVRDGDLATIHQPLSVLGLNYYMTWKVAAGTPAGQPTAFPGADDINQFADPGPRTAMGWNIDPQGLTDLLVEMATRFPGVPLLVTENGAAFDDEVSPDGAVHDPDRIAYYEGHLAAVHAAIEQGAPVKGYFAWSLLDNFEWAYGYSKRFGVVRVDYDTQVRTPKDSARWYSDFITGQTRPE